MALLLVASACGGDSGSDGTAAGVSDGSSVNGSDDAASTAAANIDALESSDDVRTLEVLDVKTGQPTTIADAVTGDRPVLLWFWAPH